jgi:hypothetical protein
MTSINRLAQALGYVKLAKQSLEPTAEFYEAYAFEKLGEVESALITGITDVTKGGDAPRQLTRDDIIEMAKRDVADLLEQYHPLTDCPMWAYVKFVVNREKRTVVALIYDLALNYVKKRGIAKCHPDDCFNAHIGRVIALRRALGLEVPDEYLNAPHPTEVRVGDKIRLKCIGHPFDGKIETVKGFYARSDGRTCILTKESIGHVTDEYYDIIDDTREDAEQEV